MFFKKLAYSLKLSIGIKFLIINIVLSISVESIGLNYRIYKLIFIIFISGIGFCVYVLFSSSVLSGICYFNNIFEEQTFEFNYFSICFISY